MSRKGRCAYGAVGNFRPDRGYYPIMRPPTSRALLLLGTAAAMAALVGATCTTQPLDRVPNGNWGGLHAGMVVSDTGAEIEYDCAAGRITAPMLLDARGNFDLPGLYIRTGPGPTPANDSLVPKFPVRYTGHANTRTMTLDVSGDSVPAQSFTLTYGGNPNVLKCV
jgi:hypothetical protein